MHGYVCGCVSVYVAIAAVAAAVAAAAGWANCLARAANFLPLLLLLRGRQQFLSCMHASLIVVGGPARVRPGQVGPALVLAIMTKLQFAG